MVVIKLKSDSKLWTVKNQFSSDRRWQTNMLQKNVSKVFTSNYSKIKNQRKLTVWIIIFIGCTYIYHKYIIHFFSITVITYFGLVHNPIGTKYVIIILYCFLLFTK